MPWSQSGTGCRAAGRGPGSAVGSRRSGTRTACRREGGKKNKVSSMSKGERGEREGMLKRRMEHCGAQRQPSAMDWVGAGTHLLSSSTSIWCTILGGYAFCAYALIAALAGTRTSSSSYLAAAREEGGSAWKGRACQYKLLGMAARVRRAARQTGSFKLQLVRAKGGHLGKAVPRTKPVHGQA